MHPQPPPHLSASSAAWWRATLDRYLLEEHHLRLLQLACEAWDRTQAAREELERTGLTYTFEGSRRPNPAVMIERDARLAVARLVRELDLDTEPPVSARQPPPIFSNRSSREGARARKITAS
jgi:P27 family predicted phage terminase small subunit